MACSSGLCSCLGWGSPQPSPLVALLSNTEVKVSEMATDYSECDSVKPTVQSLKTELTAINLQGNIDEYCTRLISCSLKLEQLSSAGVDINREFIDHSLSAYHVSIEDSSTMIWFILDDQIIECCCLHLKDFRGNVIKESEDFYVASLSTSVRYGTTGGKSNSVFMQTADGHFITKSIKEDEYDSFVKFGGQLLDHITHKPTCLNKPWGLYKLVVRGETSHFLVTDKIRIAGASNIILFDIKGIDERKRKDQTSTGLDGDLVDEMQTAGFSLKRAEMATLLRRVRSDTGFLQRNNIMDYSLLVAWNKEEGTIVYSIIDYLVQFKAMKKLEYAYKT